MPYGKRHRKHREAKGQRDSSKSDPQSWKSGCEHGGAASAKNQPERSNELSERSFRKRHGCSSSLRKMLHMARRDIFEAANASTPCYAAGRREAEGRCRMVTSSQMTLARPAGSVTTSSSGHSASE